MDITNFSKKIDECKTLDTAISQMFMVGFNGDEFKEKTAIYKYITKHKIGGVILDNKKSNKNITSPEQLKELTLSMQKSSYIPLFIGIEQAGGKTSPLDASFGVSELSAERLGEIDDNWFTYKEAGKTAIALKQLGINVNFAPCVDLYIGEDSIIGNQGRAFASRPAKTIKHAVEVVKNCNANRILPVLNHFPGYGGANGNYCFGFDDVSKTYTAHELRPYKEIIESYPNIAIMTSHSYNPKLDHKNISSLSAKTITGLLREDMKFKGLVFSEDLQKPIVAKAGSWKDVLINTINAGTDVLVMSNPKNDPNLVKHSINIVKQAIRDQEISLNTVYKAYDRITHYKLSYLSKLRRDKVWDFAIDQSRSRCLG